ncbi:MAG: guanosine monophosphate reductase [Bdellovibrionales bacterium]|nr:guanosine monophosphate reductase [Bdellovibrionales bacterium]
MFDWKALTGRGKAYTFDDVLIVPNKSDVRSRRNPDLKTRLTRETTIEKPFVSANMDTVTEHEMAIGMNQLGAIGILHRFMSISEQVEQVAKIKASGARDIAASIGVNDDFKDRAKALVESGVNILTIDIAHGHSVAMIETLVWLKTEFPAIQLIAGNVATPKSTEDLIEAGAHAIKVGIGPGSMCTTRIITGCGVPQLTAISLCAQVARPKGIPVIADGGIRSSGDIIKALAAGADAVMLGSLLSGTIESPGPIHNGMKQYRGMASKSAQASWRGGVPEGMAPEGESTLVPVKGHISDVINELSGGLRSGMLYINALGIEDIRANSLFVEMTPMGYFESRAHGLKN